jgi:Fe-S-cluster-containing hydrogenase component 2
MIRKIVQIDEAKCDGCGQCIPACAEGAIALVGGKARLTGDVLCDGLGACLGECPRGAIQVVERDAAAFDEAAVRARLAELGRAPEVQSPAAPPSAPRRLLSVVSDPAPQQGGCPGARPQVLRPASPAAPRRGLAVVGGDRAPPAPGPATPGSRLAHWPVQLHLVPESAPWFDGADLLVAADCVPFAYPRFHEDLLAGRAVVVGCPKLDDVRSYVEKLARILAGNDIRSVTVARMEVPCCGGITLAARQAAHASGKSVAVADVVVGVDGSLR